MDEIAELMTVLYYKKKAKENCVEIFIYAIIVSKWRVAFGRKLLRPVLRGPGQPLGTQH